MLVVLIPVLVVLVVVATSSATSSISSTGSSTTSISSTSSTRNSMHMMDDAELANFCGEAAASSAGRFGGDDYTYGHGGPKGQCDICYIKAGEPDPATGTPCEIHHRRCRYDWFLEELIFPFFAPEAPLAIQCHVCSC